MSKRIFSYLIIFLLFSTLFCTKKHDTESQEKILVQVGDKTISASEFKYRTEFTVRPIFPGKTPQDQKEMYLNNLIIEKFFSLEAGDSSEILQKETFQRYIKGIKEQSMREQLYYKEAFNKVELDTNEIKKVYQLAGREYDLEFFSIHKSEIVEKIKTAVESNPDSLQVIFDGLGESTGKTYKQTVKYKDPETLAIHEALFSEPADVGTIIGPLKVEDGYYVLMKVVDWRFHPAISHEDFQMRLYDVKEKMTQNKANHMWQDYMSNVMKGKSIQFEKETFNKLADLFLSIRLATDKEEKESISKEFWGDIKGDLALDAITSEQAVLDLPFFTIDGQVWTVRDFRRELMSHPLVYRKQEFPNSDFKKQFQYAIADLLRDHYLNKEAYEKSLDNHPKVKRTTEMWKDAFIAMNHRNQYLKTAIDKGVIDKDNNSEKLKYFDAYIDSLQKKYSDITTIDREELDDIELTNVNMFVLQQNVPFPIVVPTFPLATSDSKLDYAKNNLE